MLDSSEGRRPLSYLHGAGNIIPGLEAEMAGKQAGDAFKATIAPERAYGLRDERLVGDVPRSAFPAGQMLMVGQALEGRSPQGQKGVFHVVRVADDRVTVDGNHPLAGVTLTFDVVIRSVRAATEDELSHGHAHGPGGHQH